MTARLFDGRGIVIPACLLALPLGFATAKAPVLAAVGLAAVLMLALVLAWAEAVLLVLVAILPWEEMLQFPSEAVSLVKVVGLLLMAAYVLRALSQHEQLRLPGTLTAVLVFGLFVGLSLMLSTDPADGVIKTLRYALFITFFFLVVQLVRDRAMVIRVLGAITISCALASLYALAAFLQGEIARAGGPLREPVDFAYLIVAVLPIAGYLFARDSSRRVLWGACFMVMFGAMLAALSRGAVIGLAAMAVWIVASGRVPIGGVLTALVGFVTVLLVAFTFWGDLIHERLDEKGRVGAANVESRAAFWASAADLAMENPLTGVGPGRFGPESGGYVPGDPLGIKDPVAHSSFLEILAENGIFALLAFIAFLAGSWSMLQRAYRRSRDLGDRDGARLATAIQASLLIAIVSGSFLSEQLTVPFWLFGALAVSVGLLFEPEPVVATPAAAPA